MKRYVSILSALISIFAVLALSACAKPPSEEMENAAAALARAENEPNVVEYAGNTLTQAQNAYRRMNEAANAKQYDEAKLLAEEAINLAERAVSEARRAAEAKVLADAGEAKTAEEAAAVDNDEKARSDASNLINAVKSSVAEAEQALKNAQTVRNIELNTNAILHEIEMAKQLIQEAEASLAEKKYEEAEDTAADARSAVSTAMTLIAEAARERSSKK